ncbi:MAG TPA: F0F1 ATP synthase subunit B, partial [Actinomycetota bacterium]|nr:F0F1 ATP synthase subunit B [Actinomycetota bacterium]
ALLFLAQEGEHAEEASGLALVLPDTAELIWGTVCFIVVLGFLSKVAFPKIKQTLEAREQQIQGDLESAESAKAEADKVLEDYKKQVADAKSEANRIIEEGRQSAETVRKELVAKAEKEAQQIVERAQEQLANERNRTVQELQGQIADLSIELAEKVVGRSIDASSHKEMVDAYIKEVAGMSNGGASN